MSSTIDPQLDKLLDQLQKARTEKARFEADEREARNAITDYMHQANITKIDTDRGWSITDSVTHTVKVTDEAALADAMMELRQIVPMKVDTAALKKMFYPDRLGDLPGVELKTTHGIRVVPKRS